MRIEKRRSVTSHSFPTYTTLGQMVCCEDVCASTVPRPFRDPQRDECTIVSPRTYFCDGPSPRALCWAGAQFTGACVKRLGKQNLQQNIQRFVKDVRHLKLEFLCSHCVVKHKINECVACVKLYGGRPKRIQKLLPVFLFEGNNFTASTSDIRVDVELFPQMIKLRPVYRGRRAHAREFNRKVLKKIEPTLCP